MVVPTSAGIGRALNEIQMPSESRQWIASCRPGGRLKLFLSAGVGHRLRGRMATASGVGIRGCTQTNAVTFHFSAGTTPSPPAQTGSLPPSPEAARPLPAPFPLPLATVSPNPVPLRHPVLSLSLFALIPSSPQAPRTSAPPPSPPLAVGGRQGGGATASPPHPRQRAGPGPLRWRRRRAGLGRLRRRRRWAGFLLCPPGVGRRGGRRQGVRVGRRDTRAVGGERGRGRLPMRRPTVLGCSSRRGPCRRALWWRGPRCWCFAACGEALCGTGGQGVAAAAAGVPAAAAEGELGLAAHRLWTYLAERAGGSSGANIGGGRLARDGGRGPLPFSPCVVARHGGGAHHVARSGGGVCQRLTNGARGRARAVASLDRPCGRRRVLYMSLATGGTVERELTCEGDRVPLLLLVVSYCATVLFTREVVRVEWVEEGSTGEGVRAATEERQGERWSGEKQRGRAALRK